jgi:hypothetical protein
VSHYKASASAVIRLEADGALGRRQALGPPDSRKRWESGREVIRTYRKYRGSMSHHMSRRAINRHGERGYRDSPSRNPVPGGTGVSPRGIRARYGDLMALFAIGTEGAVPGACPGQGDQGDRGRNGGGTPPLGVSGGLCPPVAIQPPWLNSPLWLNCQDSAGPPQVITRVGLIVTTTRSSPGLSLVRRSSPYLAPTLSANS